MKTLAFVSVVLGTLILGSVSFTGTAANNVHKRRAVTEFDSPVVVQGVVMQGKYLFVHDNAAMARGEACSYIYKGESESPNKLVASFHCTHVERSKVNHFVVRTRQTAKGTAELIEFQFGGETAGHGVPAPQQTAVVPLVN